MWPGNTADVTTLVPVVDRLRRRFADRPDLHRRQPSPEAGGGMISAETIAALEARGLFYILGVRERTDKLVREVVLNDPRPSCRSSWRTWSRNRLRRQIGHLGRHALHRLRNHQE